MSELAFPEIESPIDATTASTGTTAPIGAPLSIKATVLAQFTSTEASLRALAERYRAVAFDVTTTKGMAEAKAARLDLRENGRYLVERAEKRIKAEVNDLKKTMADEVDRLVAIVRPAEDAIDGQIKAREEQIAAEKAEAERRAAEALRLEAERKQRHEDGIATLAGYVDKARGKTAAQIMGGIDFVRKIEIDPGYWQEYAERAQQTLDATLIALAKLHADTLQAEKDAAELAALRAEKAERDRQAAEADRVAREAECLQQAAEENRRAKLAEETAAAARTVAAMQQDAEMGGYTDASDRREPEPGPETRPEPEPVPPMTLGSVCAWLGFTLTAAFISERLGIQPAGRDKNAILYRESQRGDIRMALVTHLRGLDC